MVHDDSFRVTPNKFGAAAKGEIADADLHHTLDISGNLPGKGLPPGLLNKHVAKTTRFSSWGEMIDFATDIYARKQDKKML